MSATMLLSTGGDDPLLKLMTQQWLREREIEDQFYLEYKQYRAYLIDVLRVSNPDFTGTKGQMVRLAQRLLDRLIFILFCEDMGSALRYPPNHLRDFLIHYSQDAYFENEGTYVWDWLKGLFGAMNQGGRHHGREIATFNGGLFSEDSALNSLKIPNHIFCAKHQGDSPYHLQSYPRTLLFFSGTYNFGIVSGAERAIGFYALGRIFEQSITELEMLEADAEGRPSLTRITRRKLDGVYYTPEWVVQIIVQQTVGAMYSDLRRKFFGSEHLPEYADAWVTEQIGKPAARRSAEYNSGLKMLSEYAGAIERVTVADIACGSGAFLVAAVDVLLQERRLVSDEIHRLTGQQSLFDEDSVLKEILSKNIYGVDINPASVELARLGIWLHTARAGQPLSDLDANIVDGNSLIGPTFINNCT